MALWALRGRALECHILWWEIAFGSLCWQKWAGFYHLILFMKDCMLKWFCRAVVVREVHCVDCLWYKLKKKIKGKRYFVCTWDVWVILNPLTHFTVNLNVVLFFPFFFFFPFYFEEQFFPVGWLKEEEKTRVDCHFH